MRLWKLRAALRPWLERRRWGSALVERYRAWREARMRVMSGVRTVLRSFQQAPRLELTDETLDCMEVHRRVTVIVPVYGAPDEFSRCLDSLVRNTTRRGVDLLIIDDASHDPTLDRILTAAAELPNVTVMHNERNLGFVETVNRGFASTTGDVVVLNSDTEVPPAWLRNLAVAAWSQPRIGTVTAISDNAGAFSAPREGAADLVPGHLDHDAVGRLVARTSERSYPWTPTANGFCMYVKREVIDTVGGLDAEAFPRGYGEENDLSMKATQRGWDHVVDDATFVHHAGSASFRGERDGLSRRAQQMLESRYPEYPGLADRFVHSTEMQAVRDRIAMAFANVGRTRRRIRPRVLHVVHSGYGGIPETVRDIARGVDAYEHLLLRSTGTELVVEPLGDAEGEPLELQLPDRLEVPDTANPAYRRLVAGLLVRLQVEVAHVHHLFDHTLELPGVSRQLDVPTVFTLHDFHLVCPTIHLLDHRGDFCWGECTPGAGVCSVPDDWASGVPYLKHEWVKVWQRETAEMMGDVDAFVVPNVSMAGIYQRTHPQISDRVRVIEHGRDIPDVEPVDVPERSSGEIDILVPGNTGRHKGGDVIEALFHLDRRRERRLRFHYLGQVDAPYARYGVEHGSYQREEFFDRARRIRPRFGAILSVSAESYAHTLTECWAAGIPVLVTALGAPAERVRRHGGGWILDHHDIEGAYRRILEIDDDEEEYARAAEQARSRSGFRGLDEMADDHEELYDELRRSKRVFSNREDHLPELSV